MADTERENQSVSFLPHNIGIPLICVALGISWLRVFTLHPNKFNYTLFSFLFFFNLIITIFAIYYYLILSKITITKNTLLAPLTSYNGFPLVYTFIKRKIDISSITKIIKYPAKWQDPFVTFRLSLYGAKISIISSIANIQMSYNFYGEGQVEQMIEEILQRNENIQIIEYDNERLRQKRG